MPFARPYNRLYSFQNFQRDNPSRPAPADRVDAEFNEVKLALDQTQANLKKIQRADGYLGNGVVTQDSLSPSLSIGFTFRGAWQTDVNYASGDGVSVGSIFYRATKANLSGPTNRPDLDSVTWQSLADFTVVVDAAQGIALMAPGTPIGNEFERKADKAFTVQLPRTTARTLAAKLGDAAPTPDDWRSLVTDNDWTDAVQAGLTESAASRRPLQITKAFPVRSVTAPRFSTLDVGGGGELLGIPGGAQNSINALLEMPEGNIDIKGRLAVSGQYNLAYRRGVHVRGPQSQFLFPANLAITGFQVGYTHGSTQFPHGILSESTVTGLYTYGCPICVEVIGTETIVNFIGCPLIADVFGAPASWSSLPRRVVRSIGASAYFNGGQACIVDTVNGYIAEMQPMDSTRPTIEGTRYGAVRFYNAEVETASPFLLAHNPNGLVINQPANRSYFGMEGCGGFVSQDQVMSYVADDCPIDIVVGRSNEFPFPGGKKTKSAWFIDGTSGRAHVHAPSKPLGLNWLDPIDDVVNGVVHWEGDRTIFRAFNADNQNVAAGTATVVRYLTIDRADGLGRFSYGYNPANGFWQIQQPGGLKDVSVQVTVAFTTAVSGRAALVNQAGAELGAGAVVAGTASFVADVGKLDYNNFVYVVVNVDANTQLVSGSTGGVQRNKIVIKARN